MVEPRGAGCEVEMQRGARIGTQEQGYIRGEWDTTLEGMVRIMGRRKGATGEEQGQKGQHAMHPTASTHDDIGGRSQDNTAQCNSHPGMSQPQLQ
jgi:hypothetical protein